MERINKIMNELRKFSQDIISFEPPLSDETLVKDFEQKNSILLPKDYKYLLSLHNGLDLMGTTVYGFSGKENLDCVYKFEHNEVIYPQFDYLVPFSPDGRGNFYCFDTRIHDNDSCPVIFWVSNYEYNKDDQPELTNQSFAEWIEQVLIEWTLEYYNYDGSEKE